MNGEYRKAFGQVIAAKRREANLSKQQLALMAGTSRLTLRRIEIGEANPTINLLLRLAQALGSSLADIAVMAERILAEEAGSRPPIPNPDQPSRGYFLTRL